MNYSTAVMLINPSIRAVMGKYEENGNADTFKTLNPDVKVDDYVVVESGTRWELTVVKITAVDTDVDFDATRIMRWIVAKVDMSMHQKLKDMENAAIELIKKGELRKRREDIKKNTLDAVSAGEIDNLEIAKLANPVALGGTTAA